MYYLRRGALAQFQVALAFVRLTNELFDDGVFYSAWQWLERLFAEERARCFPEIALVASLAGPVRIDSLRRVHHVRVVALVRVQLSHNRLARNALLQLVERGALWATS